MYIRTHVHTYRYIHKNVHTYTCTILYAYMHTLSYTCYTLPHLYQDKGMVPSDGENRREGPDCEVRSKVEGEVTPLPYLTYTYTHIYRHIHIHVYCT